ncbi:MAG: hypothetical protein QM645_10180 [Asticcacaulis sp.]
MQSKNPFLDEFAKLSANAMSLMQSAGDEAKAAFQAQGDKFVAEFDLVRRDELLALKDEIAALRAEVAELKAGSPKKTAAKKTPPPETDTE